MSSDICEVYEICIQTTLTTKLFMQFQFLISMFFKN